MPREGVAARMRVRDLGGMVVLVEGLLMAWERWVEVWTMRARGLRVGFTRGLGGCCCSGVWCGVSNYCSPAIDDVVRMMWGPI
jgi:hypothetical protein